MKLLELFCGTKSIADVFQSRNHEIFTVDIEDSFNPNLCVDIMDLKSKDILNMFGRPDIIWASPPCTAFSVASIGYHWQGGARSYIPKTEYAQISQKLVVHTIELINEISPKFWFIENPRGLLRKMPFMQNLMRYTVTYCQYGDLRMKPTDIWTNLPNPGFKPICKNGDSCHVSAPRGSRTGTQGLKSAIDRGKIPIQLCEHICKKCELSL